MSLQNIIKEGSEEFDTLWADIEGSTLILPARKALVESFLSSRTTLAYKAGLERAREILFEIEKSKWKDAEHCSCLGYVLVQLAGGEDSEGGREMEKRLLALSQELTKEN